MIPISRLDAGSLNTDLIFRVYSTWDRCAFQVTVGSEKGTGSGPNKKLAKRAAAENVLLAMGYTKPAGTQPAKSAIKSGGGEQDEDDGEGGGPDKAKKVR